MLNNLYVKDNSDKVWTKVIAVVMINGVATYIDAYGEPYVVGEADVIDIEHQTNEYLGMNWHKYGVTFEQYETDYPQGV